MSYKVTIQYTGPAVEDLFENMTSTICDIFRPMNGYVNSPVYQEGYPNDGSIATGDKVYGKSIYATNVSGWGTTPAVEPFETTSIPFPTALAQFKLAIVGEPITDEDSGEVLGHQVEFTVDDYKEAFYYKTLGVQLADQGFTVTVEAASGADVSADVDP